MNTIGEPTNGNSSFGGSSAPGNPMEGYEIVGVDIFGSPMYRPIGGWVQDANGHWGGPVVTKQTADLFAVRDGVRALMAENGWTKEQLATVVAAL